MSSVVVVIGDVASDEPSKMAGVQGNDVVELLQAKMVPPMMRKNRFGWASALLAVGVFLWSGAPALRSSGSCSASLWTVAAGDATDPAVVRWVTITVDALVPSRAEVTESSIESDNTVVVRFSKTMDAVTAVDPTKLYLRDSNNTGIEGDWALEGDSLSVAFTPDTADLSDEDFPFILTVTTGVKDSLGIALGREYTRMFHKETGAELFFGESTPRFVPSKVLYDENFRPVKTADYAAPDTDAIGSELDYYGGTNLPKTYKDNATNQVLTEYYGDGTSSNTTETEQRKTGSQSTQATFASTIKRNALGRVAGLTDPAGRATTVTHDPLGRPNGSTDPADSKTDATYDALGRTETVTEHLDVDETTAQQLGISEEKRCQSRTTTYAYNNASLLEKITDAKGNITTYTFDALKRLHTITYPPPRGGAETFDYDDNDNLETYTDPNGTVVTYGYDELNRLTTVTVDPAAGVEGVGAESYDYDSLSRLTHAENADAEVDLAYDSFGRVREDKQTYKGVDPPIVKTFAYEYDDLGNLTQVTYPDATVIAYDRTDPATEEPDELQRVRAIKVSGTTEASYADFHGPARYGKRSLANGADEFFTWDDGNNGTRNLEAARTAAGSDDVLKNEYSYRPDDLIAEILRAHQGSTTDVYSYNGAKELIDAKTAVVGEGEDNQLDLTRFEDRRSYNLDTVSNFDSTSGYRRHDKISATDASSVNEHNQYTSFGDLTPTYDLNGNMKVREAGRTLFYDFRNRLVRVHRDSDDSDATFKYDPLGRRIAKQSFGAPVVLYFHTGHDLALECNDEGQIVKRSIYEEGIDRPLLMERDTNADGTLDQKVFYHREQNGSVSALTDEDGALVEAYCYGPYGLPKIYTCATPSVEAVYSDDGVLHVQFSTPMRKDTAPAKTNFGYIEDNEWHEIAGTWAMEADRLFSFTPAATITQTNLELRVQATAKDEFGCMMGVQYATPVAWDDTGEVSYDDDAAPDVDIVFQEAYTDPQDEDHTLGKLVVHFTEVITAESLTDSQTSEKRIAIYEGDEITEDMRVEGTVARLDDDKRVAEFVPDPAAQLRWGQPLILVVKAGMEDWSGTELQADQTYAFTYTEQGLLVHESADPRIIPESVAGNNLLFQGREWDQDVGMYYFRARYLDPEMGRFIGRDPLGYGDGMNLYTAFSDSPANILDPSGEVGVKTVLGFGYEGVKQLFLGGPVVAPIAAAVDITKARIAIHNENDLEIREKMNGEFWHSATAAIPFYGAVTSCEAGNREVDQAAFNDQLGNDWEAGRGFARGYKNYAYAGTNLALSVAGVKAGYDGIRTRALRAGLTPEDLPPDFLKSQVPKPPGGFEATEQVAQNGAPNGQYYSVAFRTQLKTVSYPGQSRAVHFQEANEAFLRAMESDAQFAQVGKAMGINIARTPTGLAPRQPPARWSWHHATEPGVMELVPRSQHAPGSVFQGTLHPGGEGGFSKWGK